MKGNENRSSGWSLELDLNQRQPGYEPSALPTELSRDIAMLDSYPYKHSISARAHIKAPATVYAQKTVAK